MTALDDVKVQDVKAQKKALVEAELKDAITAIRKPNRDLAGKAIVEDAAKRVSGGLSSIKSKSCYYSSLWRWCANPGRRVQETADPTSTI